MKKLKTLTIGIPAYNEESNISKLILSLLSQKQTNFVLEKIIVISDGSFDNTVKKTQKITNRKIFLIENKERIGLNKTQNKILKLSKSDLLVIVNADILIRDNNFLDTLVKPFYDNQNLGIVSTGMVAISSRSMVSRVLTCAQVFKESLYQKINGSNNVYLCHGQLRAFSKKFYAQFMWEENCPEDAFSYFSCIKSGFKFIYLPDLKVFFQTSQTIGDHILQSNRFIFGINKIKKLFGKRYIEKAYRISPFLFVIIFIQFLVKNPLLLCSYSFLVLYIRFFRRIPPVHHSKFEIASTSKILMGLIFFEL